MIPLNNAFEIINEIIKPLTKTQILKTKNALGFTLAKDQYSKLDLPSFNKSAMDGYAILQNDPSEKFEIIEIVPAGKIPRQKLEQGKTIKVMTGAPVPDHTSRIVPIENTVVSHHLMTITQNSTARHICDQGEDIKKNELILKKGTQLTPIEIANLIACGLTEVNCYSTVKVAILTTGDEIVEDMKQIKPGKIMNSNGPMLKVLCEQEHLDIVLAQIVPDKKEALEKALRNTLEKANLILLSGGVSVGDFDYVQEIFEKLKINIHFNKVAIKPGKPMTFASKENKYLFGLPGNPVSVYITFQLFAKQAIQKLYGNKRYPRSIMLPLAEMFIRKKFERSEFVPCEINESGHISPIPFHGSAHLAALLQSDGCFLVPPGTEQMDEKQLVKFYPFNLKKQ